MLKKDLSIFVIIFLVSMSLVYATSLINFENPTPDDAISTTNTSIEINVSVTEENLNELKYNWDGTNFTMYNDSLVLMYNFDNVSELGENDTYVVDISGTGNNGSVSNAIHTSNGKYNVGFTFDGIEDRINIVNPSFINDTQGTITVWISFEYLGVADRPISVSMDGLTDDELFIEMVGNDDNQLRVKLQNVASPLTVDWSADTADNMITDTNYHFIALTSNGSTTRLYLDGIEKELIDGAGTNNGQWWGSATNANVFTLGGVERTKLYNDLTGAMDEVRIWNRSLSSGEIYQQYASNLNKFNSTQWYLYVNQSQNVTTGLNNGDYTYFVSVKDLAGNSNQTEERTITVDTTPPTITPSPSGGGSSRRTITKIENLTCVSNWSCDSWSFCSKNFTQSRICNDLNNCGNKTAKPLETRICPDILFDSIIELKSKKVYPWNNLKFEVNLKEVNSGDLVDVLIIYKILKNNVVVYEESETLAIQEELIYEKEISELDLSPGKYSLLVILEYGKNQTASTEQGFSIIGLTSIGVFFIVLIFLILLGFVGYNWYISRKKTEELEEKLEEIEEKLEEKQTSRVRLKNWVIQKIETVRLRSEREKKEQEDIQKIEDKINESKIKNKKGSLRDSEEMIGELNKGEK